MDITQIIIAIVSALTGGALASFLTYKLNRRKQETSEFQLLLEERKRDLDLYREEIKILRERVSKLEKKEYNNQLEIQNLRNKLIVFESSHSDIPLPIWLKDSDGKMLFVNSHYEDMFLIPLNKLSSDYIGFYDKDIWSQDVAKGFRKNDLEVQRKKTAKKYIEKVNDLQGNIFYAKVLKYPRLHNKQVIGIGGVVLDINTDINKLKI